jgi:O-antigen ligase
VALGLTAALVTARAYAPSEPDSDRAAGTGLAWVFALLVVAGLAIAAGLVGGRFRFRWSWADAAVVALTALVALSANHAIDRRPAINLAWEWVALGVAYLLLRSLPRTRGESSALAAALVATVLAVSVYGLYQVGVEMPALRAEYREDPQKFLLKHRAELDFVPGSHEHYVWEQRFLYSKESFATFGLANSMAGFLVGPLVLALAVGFHNLVRRDAPGSRWAALGMAAPLILVMLTALMLTKSRSSYIGLFVGSGLAVWQARRAVPVRTFVASGAAGLAILVALVAAGLATGQLDREVLTQSEMSLRYRWEYWRGTWRMLTAGVPDLKSALESPVLWSGVGPGNFRNSYLLFKLPESSEEIVDPHNLFLEAWATAGVWALVALVAALGVGLWELLGPPARMPAPAAAADAGRPPPGERRTGRGGSAPVGPALRPSEEEADAPPCRPLWLVASAGAGWIVVVLLGQLNLFAAELFPRWLLLGGGWLAAIWLGRPLWRRLPIPASAFGAAVAAVVVNLLAAGGIGIPTVALGLWSTMALGLNLRDDRPCSRLREWENRLPPSILSALWAAVLGTFLGAVMPYWRSEAAVAAAEEASTRNPPDFERAERAYRRAIAADRSYVRPWLGYAGLEERAWAWRGAQSKDLRWDKILTLYHEAVRPPRNPNAWSLHILRADKIREMLQRIGSQLTPLEVISLGGEIVKETRTACRLYPSNALLHARLAQASAEISKFDDAVEEAEEALRLDRLTPHPDRKLPEPLRKQLEAQLAQWKE